MFSVYVMDTVQGLAGRTVELIVLDRPAEARFVTTARFITNEVVTNRTGIAPLFLLGYQYM